MTLKWTIKTEYLFVHGQSVEAGVWNRLNKHCKQSRVDTTCNSKSKCLIVLNVLKEYDYDNYFSYFSYDNYFSYFSYDNYLSYIANIQETIQEATVNIARISGNETLELTKSEETISHELLSINNLATFHQIHSNMCLKSLRYVPPSHKTWSDEFRNKRTAKFAKNRRFYGGLEGPSVSLLFSRRAFS